MSILEKVLKRSLMVAAVMAVLAVSASPVLAQPPIGRVATGIQVLYTFDPAGGATVLDISGVGTALDLTIEDPANASETPEGGLLIGPTTRLSNGTNDSKVYTACTAANALTVEAWIVPDNAVQGGPARLVTQSLDGGNRNFSLMQGTGVYEARLRTTTNGNNGTFVKLVGASATTDLQHVVFTRDAAGNATLYIDGVVADSDVIFGDFSNWDSTYDFGLANEFTAASTDPARDFLGEFRLVAVYCRALDVLEVLQNFDAGPDGLQCEVNADCDDGLICTGDEFCVGGVCEAGTPVVCDPDFFCSEASGGVCEPLLDPPDDPAEHLPVSCVDGQVAKYNTTTSLWECAADIDTDTDTDTNAGTLCAPGQYLDGDGTCKTPGPGLPTCAARQFPQWNGTEWICQGCEGVADGASCDDGDSNTANDQCTAGVCAGQAPPTLYVETAGGTSIIGKYDRITGAAIDASFIVPGFGGPAKLALSGNDLFVAATNTPNVFVKKYNATTGALINPAFITVPTQPIRAIAHSDSGFFVAYPPDRIGKYDATTGAVIDHTFITGVNIFDSGLAVSGNILFHYDGEEVAKYDAITGAVIDPSFISGVFGFNADLTVSGNRLYLIEVFQAQAFDATTGQSIFSIPLDFDSASSIAVSGNDLFITNNNSSTNNYSIDKYDATNGALIASGFIPGLPNFAFGMAVAGAP